MSKTSKSNASYSKLAKCTLTLIGSYTLNSFKRLILETILLFPGKEIKRSEDAPALVAMETARAGTQLAGKITISAFTRLFITADIPSSGRGISFLRDKNP